MKFWFAIHPTRFEAEEIHEKLVKLLERRGCEETEDPQNADYAVAIGGDGTVVGAFQKCTKPLLGINAGTLGFLPRVEPDGAEDAINAVIDGRFTVEKRMALSCVVNGTEYRALNEAAVLKPSVGPIRICVRVDGTDLMSYMADGIICATPTGSTGYSLSAGGPIIEPTAQMLMLTPVSPHTIVNRPVLLSPDSVVTLSASHEALLSLDGQAVPLAPETKVEIRRSFECMYFISLGSENFIERLRRKLS